MDLTTQQARREGMTDEALLHKKSLRRENHKPRGGSGLLRARSLLDLAEQAEGLVIIRVLKNNVWQWHSAMRLIVVFAGSLEMEGSN